MVPLRVYEAFKVSRPKTTNPTGGGVEGVERWMRGRVGGWIKQKYCFSTSAEAEVKV